MADEIELLRLVSELIPEPTSDAWARAEAAIAAAREEDLLRQGMERSAGPRRRLARRSAAMAAAVAALAACALVLAAVAMPGARHNVPGARNNGIEGPTVDTAYVAKRVNGALSAAGPTAIAHMTITTNGPIGTSTAEEWSYGAQWRSVVYSSARQPTYDEGFSTSSVYTLVSYPARTWVRQHEAGSPAAPVPGPRGCGRMVAALPLLFGPGLLSTALSAGSPPATVVSALRTAISCGTLAMAGRQRVDGIEAIELTSRPGSLLSETIWVSPGTYLPVRVVVRSAPDTPVFRRTADITWLKPTAQSLAKLTVPIPAGFRQVPLGPSVTPIPSSPHISGPGPGTTVPSPPGGFLCRDRRPGRGTERSGTHDAIEVCSSPRRCGVPRPAAVGCRIGDCSHRTRQAIFFTTPARTAYMTRRNIK